MNMLMVHIMLIALCTAVACAVPGVFMLLRGVSLMSDAISHALLLGIVLMFLLVRSLTSPFLLFGAGLAGVAVVLITEWLLRYTQLKKDAAIGLVFPLFFSVAIILICLYTRDVHLDMDMVLLGDLAFAPFTRLYIGGVDCGPQALWIMAFLAMTAIILTYLCERPLTVALFDPAYAAHAGYQPHWWYYGLMTLVSIVAVGAFNVVGAIVVVALMITPPATAFCTARSVRGMVVHAIGYASSAAIGGYALAAGADVSIAGSIATVSGIIFSCVIIGTLIVNK